eukprot:maker-scaffold_14-snap-gene-10.21-mRNA-1 protein AED:0.19 eAED:0.20 QI:0/0/0/1/1/1/2/0/412
MLNIEKRDLDICDYKYHKLANGVKCMVVHDPDCLTNKKKAAACLSLQVGKLHEPKNIPGLAHFCEHMLFLGTEEYPVEGDYKRFAKQHGGTTNASTSDTYTKYQFSISSENFVEMLRRFSSFFVSPLFTKDSVDREVQAVCSEHSMKYTMDSRRILAGVLLDVEENHLLHWGSGNEDTLIKEIEERNLDLHEEVKNFFHKFYVAEMMTLCLIGGESLEQLLDLAKELFERIPKGNGEIVKYGEELNAVVGPVFSKEKWNVRVNYYPSKDIREIRLEFLFPWLRDEWKNKPTRILSHLLGHEGKGSLLSCLKDLNLVDGLSCYGSDSSGCFTKLQVQISCTDQVFHLGENQREEQILLIVNKVFEYIDLIKSCSAQDLENHWNETKQTADIKFRFGKSARNYSHANPFLLFIS